MRRTRFDDWPCPIARTTDLIGDWWTPLVMREAFVFSAAFGSLFGFVGMLVAVPVAAMIGVLVRYALDRYREGRLYRGLEALQPDEDDDPEEVRRKLSRRYDLCDWTCVYTTTLLTASDTEDLVRWA